jgi:hypothetical protein
MPTNDAPHRWERFVPLSGAAFTILMVTGAVAFPMPPSGDVSPASNPDWLAAHHDAVIAQSYVRGLAAVAFIALAIAAASACRRTLNDRSTLPALALIGGAFTGVLLLAAQTVSLAAALYVHADSISTTTRALGTLQEAFLDMASLPAVLLFAAVGLTALRTGFLPRWFAAFTLFGVPFALLDAVSYDGGPFESIAMLGLVYFLAWGLLAGVRLYLASQVQGVERREPMYSPGA